MESKINIDDVIKRLLAASRCGNQGDLSVRLGHARNAIASGRTRHKKKGGWVGMPLREAAQLALEEGHSLDWLILGREPARSGYQTQAPRVDDAEVNDMHGQYNHLPTDLIRAIVMGVESALSETGRTMAPENKADLVATLVDMYAGAHTSPSSAQILRLVRSAS